MFGRLGLVIERLLQPSGSQTRQARQCFVELHVTASDSLGGRRPSKTVKHFVIGGVESYDSAAAANLAAKSVLVSALPSSGEL